MIPFSYLFPHDDLSQSPPPKGRKGKEGLYFTIHIPLRVEKLPGPIGNRTTHHYQPKLCDRATMDSVKKYCPKTVDKYWHNVLVETRCSIANQKSAACDEQSSALRNVHSAGRLIHLTHYSYFQRGEVTLFDTAPDLGQSSGFLQFSSNAACCTLYNKSALPVDGLGAVFRQLGLKGLNLRVQLFNLELESLNIVLHEEVCIKYSLQFFIICSCV